MESAEGLVVLPDSLISPENRPPTPVETIVGNGYRSREIRQFTINGETQNWHSLKGGTKKEKLTKNDAPSFEVFYNPDKRQWLKIVLPNLPPHLAAENLKRLKTSAAIQRKACEVAELPDLANTVREVTVLFPDGMETYGVITPHLGASLEYLLTPFVDSNKNPIPGKLPQDTKTFLAEIYRRTYNQAQDLWLMYGFVPRDANPGNILLHEYNGSFYPLLIDFSNTNSTPDIAYPNTKKKLAKLYMDNVQDIYIEFTKHCTRLGIPTNFDTQSALERVKKIVEARTDLPEG